MKEQLKNQASGASETTSFFGTQISPVAGVAGELKQKSRNRAIRFLPCPRRCRRGVASFPRKE